MPIVLNGTTGITTPALDTATRIAPTDLGTGTPDATNFLRGDGSWQVISTTPTTDQVLTATAGATAGAVGTYAFAIRSSAVSTAVNATLAGSSLNYASAETVRADTAITGAPIGGVLSVTWRCMGTAGAYSVDPTRAAAVLWLRIS